MKYYITAKPTPILNSPDFDIVFGGKTGSLLLDENHLLRFVEMIAFPETVFTVIAQRKNFILEVKTEIYPSPGPLFVDSRFGRVTESKSISPSQKLPPAELILKRMKDAEGLPYVWGGNYRSGIPDMLTYYPPMKKISPNEKLHWIFQGLDCSGLLYEATDRAIPRNTFDLIPFGRPVPIEGLSNQAISSLVKPLDIAVWLGHMMIVLDQESVIESKYTYGGVTISPIIKRLDDITRDEGRMPSNDPIKAQNDEDFFVIRRFI